jgi:hypothetical protein
MQNKKGIKFVKKVKRTKRRKSIQNTEQEKEEYIMVKLCSMFHTATFTAEN